MKIGNIEIKNELSLGPMAGITNSSFRQLCKEHGCGLLFSEMISAKGLVYNDESTKMLLRFKASEQPLAYQIFGSEPDIMKEAAEKIEILENEIVDINMGCPAPKIVKNGDGSALLKNPKLVSAVVEKVVSATKKPVTVKIRIGWDDTQINGVEISKRIEAAGAKALTVHGRTRVQFYSGKADWGMIGKIKEAVGIPVIGNGDVWTAQDAIALKEQTNCDGIMIARGAQGNPWIFRELLHYFETGESLEQPSKKEKIEMVLRHLGMLIEEKGEYIAVREMRKHIGWYLKGMYGANEVRRQLNDMSSKVEIINMLNEYLGVK